MLLPCYYSTFFIRLKKKCVLKKKNLFRTKWFFISSIFLILIIIFTHNISKEITLDDIKYIKKFIADDKITTSETYSSYSDFLSFDQQISLIKKIQDNVLKIAPIGIGIPQNKSRNPKDLYLYRMGLCYDRSNVLEKIFNSMGFKTRHLSLFEKKINQSILKELTTKRIKSHSIFEIQTKNGWLIIDTNVNWISLSFDNIPISMEDLVKKNYKIIWQTTPPEDYYSVPYTYIYGLYSRHGRFYKPYNFIPDYRIQELIYNF